MKSAKNIYFNAKLSPVVDQSVAACVSIRWFSFVDSFMGVTVKVKYIQMYFSSLFLNQMDVDETTGTSIIICLGPCAKCITHYSDKVVAKQNENVAKYKYANCKQTAYKCIMAIGIFLSNFTSIVFFVIIKLMLVGRWWFQSREIKTEHRMQIWWHEKNVHWIITHHWRSILKYFLWWRIQFSPKLVFPIHMLSIPENFLFVGAIQSWDEVIFNFLKYFDK